MNGGGTHSSARLSLCAVTGRGESIPFDIISLCVYFSNKGSVIAFICSTGCMVVVGTEWSFFGVDNDFGAEGIGVD